MAVAALAVLFAHTGQTARSPHGPRGTSLNINVGPTATPAACTQTFTAAGYDNTPYNGDAVNTVVQGAGSTGKVLCFATGTYAGVDLYTASPTVDVTLRPANGAAVTMGTITANHVSHVVVRDFTGSSNVDAVQVTNSAGNSDHISVIRNEIVGGGSQVVGNANTNAAILYQGNRFNGQSGAVTDLNRLKIGTNTGCPSGITIDDNEMLNGTADGLDVNDSCGVIVSNNYIHDIGTPIVGGCSGPHCDAIQINSGATNSEFFGNLIETTDTGIADYDGPSSGTYIHNNVFWNVVGVGSGTINVGSTTNPVVEHNTIGGSGVAYINFGSKIAGIQTTGVVVRNNITPNGVAANGDQGATYTTNNYNMCSSGCSGANSLTGKTFGTHYSFTGGTPPLGVFSGYALAGGSAGKSVASDSTDIGVNP